MNPPIRIGNIELRFISGGQLRIDGGNMFGVIPRVLWEKLSPPDAQHRIRLDTNCVLVRTGNTLGLIDTGYGGKITPKQGQRYALEDGEPLARNLAAIGIERDDIDWVILTHLHFDHAGGATRRDAEGRLQPTFPRARHHVQRAEWEDATADLPELVGAYYPNDFVPLHEAGLVELLDGAAEIAPGISTQPTGGHTRGHQIVRVESAGDSAVVLADMCPTSAHLPTLWTMSYDQFPLEVRRIKPKITGDIVDHNRVALFSHDPDVRAARLSRDSKGEWRIVPVAAS
jgi:glyoxylase-like metal-dependent hydrolase (beta-lactamase superfamily II)